jgi:hypothetical protein
MININSHKEFVIKNKSQSHLCICNTGLFDNSINNGVYGFPHSGRKTTKSFWRAVSSMYNIGPFDLIFLYRTNGESGGCKEIHGPLLIYNKDQNPCIYYDPDSSNYQMRINGTNDCKVRFLFENMGNELYSITDNFELIKKFELKEIWGYRHPAVMNIGAARKKSVTSFTNKQTLAILDLLQNFGKLRHTFNQKIPLTERLDYYDSFPIDSNHFRLNDQFILSSKTNDEAYLYSYIIRGIKNPISLLYDDLISDLSDINDEMLSIACHKKFIDFTGNVMMEVIISPHLQDELDIIFFDLYDDNMLFFEVKEGVIDQEAINQTQKYLGLLKAIFPKKNIFANVIGSDNDPHINITKEYEDKIRLVKYEKTVNERIKFSELNLTN